MMRITKSLIKRSRAGKGSVALIAILLIGSAALRLISGATEAFAADGTDPMAGPPLPVTTVETDEATTLPAQPETLPDKAQMTSLLAALQEREARVLKRETQIAVREKALAVARVEIERRLDVLEQTEQTLRATLSRADTAAEEDVAKLTTVYENMKPKDAAALFEQMQPEFAAGFLGRMRPDAAANIMAGLNPQTAYTISVILAGRNARAPKT